MSPTAHHHQLHLHMLLLLCLLPVLLLPGSLHSCHLLLLVLMPIEGCLSALLLLLLLQPMMTVFLQHPAMLALIPVAVSLASSPSGAVPADSH